jgi:hypothetical protein
MAINSLSGAIGAPGPWTAYTPAWTASGTAPAIGNSTVTASYCQVGKIVYFKGVIVFGSTATYGTGAYYLSLPTNAIALAYQPIAQVLYVDSSASTFYYGWADCVDAVSKMSFRVPNVGGTYPTLAVVQNTVPMTFANGDSIHWLGFYEAA